MPGGQGIQMQRKRPEPKLKGRTEMRNRQIVHRIPGGWYGNDPGVFPSDPRKGVVSVDPSKLVNAITWLRRRATITETSIDAYGAILLKYRIGR